MRPVTFVALAAALGCTQPDVPSATRTDALSLPARPPRRLSGPQLRQALEAVTGEVWRGAATIPDPTSFTGTRLAPDADLLALYAPSLGAPDFDYTVRESLEPTITFAKYAEDAVRATCRAAAARSPSPLVVTPGDDEAARRQNVTALVLRFFGDEVDPTSADVTALLEVHASGGWGAVCVALATHPRFLTF